MKKSTSKFSYKVQRFNKKFKHNYNAIKNENKKAVKKLELQNSKNGLNW